MTIVRESGDISTLRGAQQCAYRKRGRDVTHPSRALVVPLAAFIYGRKNIQDSVYVLPSFLIVVNGYGPPNTLLSWAVSNIAKCYVLPVPLTAISTEETTYKIAFPFCPFCPFLFFFFFLLFRRYIPCLKENESTRQISLCTAILAQA